MTEIRRRENDPEWSEKWRERDDPMELRLGMNGKSIQAKGLTVIVVIVLAAAVASNLYAGFRLEQSFAKTVGTAAAEHKSLKRAQDRMSCMMAIPIERRNEFRAMYQPGAFERWCPWVMDE